MGIEFNHLYVTLDTETLESIAESEFINQSFCTVSRDTVETDTERWSGIYLRGNYAYLELFSPGGAEGLQEGFSGIGFNTQQAGQIDSVAEKLRALSVKETFSDLRVRHTESGIVSWFHYLTLNPSEREAFAAWVMEFHQDYLDYKNITLTPGGCFDRAAYLKTLDTSETSLFEDISEVQLELTVSENEELALLLRSFGYHSSGLGDLAIYRSDGLTVQVSQNIAPRYRIRQVVCTIKEQPHPERMFTFGDNAKLKVGREFAIWQFG